jgi:hypothetical protein
VAGADGGRVEVALSRLGVVEGVVYRQALGDGGGKELAVGGKEDGRRLPGLGGKLPGL